MAFETWGRSLRPPDCGSSYEVVSILDIELAPNVKFEYTYDHSKFGVSLDASTPIVCMGDINRMES